MGTFKVNIEEKSVTFFGQKTKTKDGAVVLDTTISYKSATLERLLFDAASHGLIAWRAGSGIKDLTTAEALMKFEDYTVDRSKTAEKVKHVETEQEKRTRILMQVIMSGKDIPGVLTVAQARAEILAMPVMQETKNSEEISDEELEAGEDAELEEKPTEAA